MHGAVKIKTQPKKNLSNGSSYNNNNNINLEYKKNSKSRLSYERLRRQVHEQVKDNNNNKNKTNEMKKDSDFSMNSKGNQQSNDDKIMRAVDPGGCTQKTPKINEKTKNQLTERVLNWLDLAGKNILIRPETAKVLLPQNKDNKDNEFMQLLPKRRILTTESLKKPLRRAEQVHHLSLTLNESDLNLYNNRRFFEASSRCASAFRFGDIFLSNYRNSRKINNNLTATNCNHEIAFNNQFSNLNYNFPVYLNNPLTMETTKSKGSKKQDQAEIKNMEKEYKNMIHRQILENNCNTQIAKRQLHIFMPNVPKKAVGQQDSDSCISTLVSDPSNKA